ncbi:MAG: hypothetical protein HXS48_16540 [Theionarchaea archaeon]|nr:hypothetical protein [Theionarchaea archaeon]
MGDPITKCKNCGREVEPHFEYCPYCGLLVHVPDRMKYDNSDSLKKKWESNIDLFTSMMKGSLGIPKILDEMGEMEPEIVKKQREFTELILDRFPIIKERILDDQSLVFYADLIDIPYLRNEDEYQHDCIQEKLSAVQDGAVNIAVGSREVSSYIYRTDLAISATEEPGESLLSKQSRILYERIPDGQREFLISAEPWDICDRVYNYEGTWIIWKLLFKTHGLNEWVRRNKCAPINFQRLSNLKYANLFPIGGTRKGGEIILAIVEKSEKKAFNKAIRSMKNFDDFNLIIKRKEIEISWETLEELGIICQAAIKAYSGKSGHIFTKTMADLIFKTIASETGSYTEKANVSEFEGDEFLKGMARTLISNYKMEWHEEVLHKVQPIPRELRKKYGIEFKR